MKKITKEKIFYGILYTIGIYLLLVVSDGIKETMMQFLALTLIVVSLEGVEWCNKKEKYE